MEMIFRRICAINMRPDYFFLILATISRPFLFISLTSNLLPAVTGPAHRHALNHRPRMANCTKYSFLFFRVLPCLLTLAVTCRAVIYDVSSQTFA
jgi:hypothetical protein